MEQEAAGEEPRSGHREQPAVEVAVAITADEAAKLDAWISKQRERMNRADAVRAILAHALRYEL